MCPGRCCPGHSRFGRRTHDPLVKDLSDAVVRSGRPRRSRSGAPCPEIGRADHRLADDGAAAPDRREADALCLPAAEPRLLRPVRVRADRHQLHLFGHRRAGAVPIRAPFRRGRPVRLSVRLRLLRGSQHLPRGPFLARRLQHAPVHRLPGRRDGGAVAPDGRSCST